MNRAGDNGRLRPFCRQRFKPGERRVGRARHDTNGIRLDIAAPGCRSSVRRSIDPNCPQAGHEKLSHGTPPAMAAPIVG
jgi:hypothetical protein